MHDLVALIFTVYQLFIEDNSLKRVGPHDDNKMVETMQRYKNFAKDFSFMDRIPHLFLELFQDFESYTMFLRTISSRSLLRDVESMLSCNRCHAS